MSFFGTLFGLGKRILGGIVGGVKGLLGIGAKVPAAAAAVATRAAGTLPGRIALGGAAALAGGAAFGVGQRLVAPGAAGQQLAAGAAGLPGGNGAFVTVTTIQTFNRATGEVVSQESLPGRPHLMNRDIAIAKRVFRTASKLGARLPKKMQRPSRASMLKDQIIDNAFQHALHHGAHGAHSMHALAAT